MKIAHLTQIIDGGRIDDVLLPGFVDKEELPLRFHASLSSYYFDCGGTFLRFSAIGYSGRGLLTVVPEITCDLDLDDDLVFASTSIKQLVLRDPDGSNHIERISLWNSHDGPSGIECSAMRLDLVNQQALFLDPSYHYGIRVGGPEQEQIWLENTPSQEHVVARFGQPRRP